MDSPEIFILAGPNGAGKTTAADYLLPSRFADAEFINADVIAESRGLRNEPIAAGRLMLERMHLLREARRSFAFETTLAARSYAPFLRGAQARGYFVHLLFIALRSAELARSRVADRVAGGGHDVPAADIERRFTRGLRNFFEFYQPLANAWTLCDNSGDEVIIVAQGGDNVATCILVPDRYGEIRSGASR